MTEAPDRSDGYTEMDLGQMLRVLFQRKWLLFGVTVLVGVAAAALSLTKPNVYESTAALIVREPQTGLEQDPEKPALVQQVPTLSVETLQTLAESTETVRMLFDKLWEDRAIEDWAEPTVERDGAFRAFQGALSTELKKQQNRRSASAVELQPVLFMRVRWGAPETAQVIANEWATIVQEKSKEIFTAGLGASGTFISGMFSESNKELEELEDSLKQETLKAKLRLQEARQTTYTEKIITLEDAILEIDVELAVNTKAIAEGTRRALEQEFEGEWIGTVAEDLRLRGEPYPFVAEEISELAHKVVELVEQKVAQREALRLYRQEQNLLAKEKQFAHYEEDIARVLMEKAKFDDELPALTSSLAALEKQLESIPEKIVLSKAITDDALWQSFLEGGETEDKSRVPLQSESMNPVHQSTMQAIVDKTAEIEMLRGRSAQLEASAEAVNKKMNDLELEIDEIQQEIDRRTQALEATESQLQLLREDYLTERNRVDELTRLNMRKEEEKLIREEKQEDFVTVLDTLEEQVTTSKLLIEQITREVETTKDVRTALASKANAADLLKVTMEGASNTGLAILYNAEANPRKVAPSRSKMVLASMLGALLLTVFLVSAWEVARPPA